MDYQLSNFTDRESEYPNRRKLIDIVTGEEKTYDVQRAEGIISQEGTPWNAQTMNDFDQKIAKTFGIKSGSFTPGVPEYNVYTRIGHYYKIGNLVYINMYLYSDVASHAEYKILMTDLPFRGYSGDSISESYDNVLLCGYFSGSSQPGTKYGIIPKDSNVIEMYVTTNNSQNREGLMYNSGNVLELRLSGIYRTND